MKNPRHSAAALMLIGCAFCQPVQAQIVPKVPPKSAPTPEYVPPAPPTPPARPKPPERPAPEPQQGTDDAQTDQPDAAPPAPPKPVEPPVSIVNRDKEGKVIPIVTHPELEALALMKFEAAEREKIDAALAKRRRELEEKVIAKPEVAFEIRRQLAGLEQEKDLRTLFTLREKVSPIAASTSPIEFLARQGAITPAARSRLERAVKEYEQTLNEQWQLELGDDAVSIMAVIAREKNRQVMYEPMAALDRLLERGAKGLDRLAEDQTISASVREQLAGLRTGVKPGSAQDQNNESSTAAFGDWLEHKATAKERAEVLAAIAKFDQ